jgi:histone H3/H4
MSSKRRHAADSSSEDEDDSDYDVLKDQEMEQESSADEEEQETESAVGPVRRRRRRLRVAGQHNKTVRDALKAALANKPMFARSVMQATINETVQEIQASKIAVWEKARADGLTEEPRPEDTLRLSSGARAMLHAFAESYMLGLVDNAMLFMGNRDKHTMQPKDMLAAESIRYQQQSGTPLAFYPE